MSKAFTKEDDSGADEPWQEPEVELPPGVKNYVTPAEGARLKAEVERLRGERRDAKRDGRLRVLTRRLELTEVIDPLAQPPDRVLFGATVTVRDAAGAERRYRIVGVDEADPSEGSVSFLSPLARALLQARAGDVVTLRRPGGEQELEVARIEYLPG